MSVCLGYNSALRVLRHLRAGHLLTIGKQASQRKMLKNAATTKQALHELDASAQFLLGRGGTPLQLLAGQRGQLSNTVGIETRLCSLQLPQGAFWNLGHDVYSASPELVFLQLAATCDVIDLIKLGMEFCGHYGFNAEELTKAYGPLSWGAPRSGQCYFGLDPLTTRKQLEAFVAKLSGVRSVVRARKAIKWVVDGSASPMETATYLLLCLPRRVGGYGLPKPVLNRRVRIKRPHETVERYPDLYWPDKRIDVEYNSDDIHSGEWKRYKDAKREVELTSNKIHVLPLTRIQLMDVSEFDEFAHSLRRMLGVKRRSPDIEWEIRRTELRRQLLVESQAFLETS